MARRTRSGTLVGPGICRKCRPALRGMGFSISTFLHFECKICFVQGSQAITPIGRRPLHEEAVERLRDMIVQGRLNPGDRLNERLLCEELGISRTPLREAIKLLAAEGLIDLLPNRGAVVSPLELARLSDTFKVMGALEGLAGGLAWRNPTPPPNPPNPALQTGMSPMDAPSDRAGDLPHNQANHLQ